jgi:hypothetical protein
MKRLSFVMALLAAMIFGSLAIENAAAQNTNSSTTMERHDMGMRGRHHRRGHHRRHRRHGMHKTTGNANM